MLGCSLKAINDDMKHFNLMQKQHPYELMSRSFNEQWLQKIKNNKKNII